VKSTLGIITVLSFVLLHLSQVQAASLEANGRITFLRVHDMGTGYGSANDFLDAEVVMHLDTQPSKTFGLHLRSVDNLPSRQAMLDLVRDAFDNNRPVTIDYNIDPGKNGGVIIRVWVTK
jgi:hypothetical protein